MTDTTAGEGVSRPKFGDIVENGWASEDNPTRRGFFVREITRSGKINPGRTWKITDGKGKFWEFNPKHIAEEGRLKVFAAQPSASVEALIAETRAKLPDAGPEAIARHLYTYLAANPDMSNALWLIQGLKDVIGRERTEQTRIMGDFKDAAPGAAAVAAHDSFLRANPHLNESDPNVRA